MRELPPSLTASLASGVTTLARCWRVQRRDGVVLGFTDHDRDLAFDGVSYLARSGLSGTTIERATGMRADSHSITGALQSQAIDEAEIHRGLYDSAEVQLWLVDWTDTTSRTRLATGRIGEIRRSDNGFEAEVLGLSEQLEQPAGRAFIRRCHRRLGDGICRVDTALARNRGAGTVSTVVAEQRFTAAGLAAYIATWFTEGTLTWTSGANQGVVSEVKNHLSNDGIATLDLWLEPPEAIQPGDQFVVVAGCDKRAETCRVKFDNILNFGGFPHMPGDDWVTGYRSGGGHDGGSLVDG
ncbi:MAG: DUF2163 domain-containing protein [Pseudomonadota bacterium]